MGTRSSAVRKQPTETPLPAPPQADPELSAIMERVAAKFTRPDGSFDAVAVLAEIHGILGAEKYPAFEGELAAYLAPDGIVEILAATYAYGWRGKLHTACSVAGGLLAIGVFCEIAGRIGNIPVLQVGTWLARRMLGD